MLLNVEGGSFYIFFANNKSVFDLWWVLKVCVIYDFHTTQGKHTFTKSGQWNEVQALSLTRCEAGHATHVNVPFSDSWWCLRWGRETQEADEEWERAPRAQIPRVGWSVFSPYWLKSSLFFFFIHKACLCSHGPTFIHRVHANLPFHFFIFKSLFQDFSYYQKFVEQCRVLAQ